MIIAVALALGSVSVAGGALAQTKPGTTKSTTKEAAAPGKECKNLKPNTQEHKDCIAKLAKDKKPTTPAAKKP
ncbi:MAG: hypothetical protein HYR63_10650 [Proteobacteria bacterium]|nr:hypothetical protein [Pseudomonadota bacterium]